MTWEGRLGHEPGRSRSVLASASVSSSVWVPAQSLVPVAQYYLTPLCRPVCFTDAWNAQGSYGVNGDALTTYGHFLCESQCFPIRPAM